MCDCVSVRVCMHACACMHVHACVHARMCTFVREGKCREVLMERTTGGSQDPATKGLMPFVVLDTGTSPNVMYFF